MIEHAVLETLADLVRINSVNPAYEGGVGEGAMCAYIRGFFQDRGIETWEQEVFPGRSNLIARVPGHLPGRRVILEAHTDTASVTGMTIPPFEPRLEGDRMYGRGACDTKGGLAAMMHAVASLKDGNRVPPCEVWFAAVADEEHSFRGVARFCEHLVADAAIVAEPTELRAVIASKGVLRWRIIVRGRAAHSSKPELGVNAIAHAARVILAMEKDHEALATRRHPLLGPATCNVGVIHGGVQVNFVPDECIIEIDRRLLPGETAGTVLAGYERMLNEIKTMLPAFSAEMEAPMLVDEALETSPEARVVHAASAVLKGMNLDSSPAGVPFGSDASKLSRQGIPSIILGPGSIDRAHAAIEYVEVDQVIAAVDFYREFLLCFE